MTRDKSRPQPYDRATGNISGGSPSSDRDHELLGYASGAAVRPRAMSYVDIAQLIALLDVLLIVLLGAVTGLALGYGLYDNALIEMYRILPTSVLAAFVYFHVAKFQKLYDPSRLLDWSSQLVNVALAWAYTLGLLLALLFMFRIGATLSRTITFGFAVSGGAALLANRLYWLFFLERATANQALLGRNAIVLGLNLSSPAVSIIKKTAEHYGARVERLFNLPDSPSSRLEETLDAAILYARMWRVDEILLVGGKNSSDRIYYIRDRLRVLPVAVTLIADDAIADLVERPRRAIGSVVGIELQRPPLTTFELACKRTIDILCAGCGLILLMPLLIATAIIIKIDSPGPILFRQMRRGFNGSDFHLYKFRSLSLPIEAHTQTKSDYDRQTRIGGWLRRTNIDELPQLFNVLRGEMSMVGPRPLPLAVDDHLTPLFVNYAFRHHLKPGITGWASVNGYRGKLLTVDAMQEQAKYDLWYVDNWSLWLDFAIICRTLFVVEIESKSKRKRSFAAPSTPFDAMRTDESKAAPRGDWIVPTAPPSSIFVGNHQYPLRSTAVLQYDGTIMHLGFLEALGSTWEAAFDRISRRLHRSFQRLWLIPMHERSTEQQAEWEKLIEIVDVDAYLTASREEERVIGRVDAVDDYVARLTLLTHGDQQVVAQISELPAIAAGMQDGQYFEARIIRLDEQRVEWRYWTPRPPLRDDDDVWIDFDQLTAQGTLE
jgi:putative colanic acid biosynthesis UDP-glucose lipid carrier transferase